MQRFECKNEKQKDIKAISRSILLNQTNRQTNKQNYGKL